MEGKQEANVTSETDRGWILPACPMQSLTEASESITSLCLQMLQGGVSSHVQWGACVNQPRCDKGKANHTSERAQRMWACLAYRKTRWREIGLAGCSNSEGRSERRERSKIVIQQPRKDETRSTSSAQLQPQDAAVSRESGQLCPTLASSMSSLLVWPSESSSNAVLPVCKIVRILSSNTGQTPWL